MSKNQIDDIKKKYLREEYISRINRVIDYIEKNIDEELSLEILARVANFSRFHFHRIFSAMVGETLNHFIQRIRVEKAAMKLAANPKTSITDIAFDCGFSGSAAFSRAFREVFQMSPSQWRSKKAFQDSKICKTNGNNRKAPGKIGKDFDVSFYYNYGENQNLIWRIKMKDKKQQIQVEVKDMPDFNVAYVRHIGPYKGDSQLFENLFKKLMTWAGPRGLLRFPETKCISVYHDDPNVTDEAKLRTDVCITVPEDTAVEGEIGKMKVPGGKFAVAHCEVSADEYEDAWNMLMGGWLPESGYQPDDRLCYELYLNDPKEHPENKHIVDICLPVKPL
ncbi:MAG: AraC family transcriptional regulator [Candidatus Aminicenantes bacterium]|nr:MAG: AraC family transcriptional regulator [Candidatus Aminicenantes bacterium]